MGGQLKSRGEEFELAFDGFEGEAAGVGKRPAEWALKPFGAVVFHATGDLRDADDAAGFKGVRQVGEVVFAFDVGERFGCRIGFALAGVDAVLESNDRIQSVNIVNKKGLRKKQDGLVSQMQAKGNDRVSKEDRQPTYPQREVVSSVPAPPESPAQQPPLPNQPTTVKPDPAKDREERTKSATDEKIVETFPATSEQLQEELPEEPGPKRDDIEPSR